MLTGKKILISGASSGIGQAAAIMISRQGGSVVLTGRDKKRLDHTLSQLEGQGHYAIPFDLMDVEGINEFVKSCVKTDGKKFDGLVYSAGTANGTVLRTENIENIKSVMTVNCFAYIAMLKALSQRKSMNDNASIVAVSSRAAFRPDRAQISYSSSKAAMDTASEVAAMELVSRGIRVNTVRPEVTYTIMADEFMKNTTEEQRKQWYPLGLLTPEDVANTIVFLLSDMSSKMTGQHIYLSAGNDGSHIDYLV